ncbi:uncharacterized protein LOC131945872 isoform X1 [Physella acuta]|jgi:hypothetical protein|uniref:uncharacterized protein LOC131945872 isoform X1 n=1 Tax=Physella acuta TaxID=109671 RepID=UPI0027DB6674|nr:uncharacterized protein LOC131945872 isoform X1 [Physella acuta]
MGDGFADNDRVLKEIDDALRGERVKISVKNDIVHAENLKLIEEFDRVIDTNQLQHKIDTDIQSRIKQMKKKLEAMERRDTENSIYDVLSGSNVSVNHPLFCGVDRSGNPLCQE